MLEQLSLLATDYGGWIFIPDSNDDGPKRAWRNREAAIKELEQEGWKVVESPGLIRALFAELEDLNRIQSWGSRLTRMV